MKAWVTCEKDGSVIIYRLWATEPEWARVAIEPEGEGEWTSRWLGKGGTGVEVCGHALKRFLGTLPEIHECFELKVTRGPTWIPPD